MGFWTVWNDFLLQIKRSRERRRTNSAGIHSPLKKPFDQIKYAAIAVHDDNGQRHVGVLYRGADGKDISLLHLAWHFDLTNEIPDNSYFWVQLGVPERRARQLASKCRQVAMANGKHVPYGFSPPTAKQFDPQSARFLFGPTWTGLTCASFVLAVFEYAGIRLSLLDWSAREDDKKWQERIVDLMKRSHARRLQFNKYATKREAEEAKAHIAAVEAEIGCGLDIDPRKWRHAAFCGHPPQVLAMQFQNPSRS